jgi:pimeloyl-ACP methyl ester carboxylesterase
LKNHSRFANAINRLLEKSEVKKGKHRNYDAFKGTGDFDLKRIFSDIMGTSLKSWLFTFENFADFDGLKILKSMSQPVLVIQGRKDKIFDVRVAKKIKNLIKRSRLLIVPRANHIIVINNPEAVEKELFTFAVNFFEV